MLNNLSETENRPLKLV